TIIDDTQRFTGGHHPSSFACCWRSGWTERSDRVHRNLAYVRSHGRQQSGVPTTTQDRLAGGLAPPRSPVLRHSAIQSQVTHYDRFSSAGVATPAGVAMED